MAINLAELNKDSVQMIFNAKCYSTLCYQYTKYKNVILYLGCAAAIEYTQSPVPNTKTKFKDECLRPLKFIFCLKVKKHYLPYFLGN